MIESDKKTSDYDIQIYYVFINLGCIYTGVK